MLQCIERVYQMRADLLLDARGPLSAERGMVFDYFDQVREVIETARSDRHATEVRQSPREPRQ